MPTNLSVRAPKPRGMSTSPRKMLLLAPSGSVRPGFFSDIRTCRDRFEDRKAEMQTLRGRIYLQDGAISPQQLSHGRHAVPLDDDSWHLLILDDKSRVCGCARYREYSNPRFSDLTVAKSALAHSPEWGTRMKSSIEGEIALARRLRVPYVELGGWALTEEVRGTSEALRMALASL